MYVSYQCLKIDGIFYLVVLPRLVVNLFYLSDLSGMRAKEGNLVICLFWQAGHGICLACMPWIVGLLYR